MLDDRDYMRDDQRSRDPFWASTSWTPVKILIVANVAVFVLQHLLQVPFVIIDYGRGSYDPAGGLSRASLASGHIWTLVTHMFVHSGFDRSGLGLFHILGNLLMIYVFGRQVQERLGRRNFWIIYFVGGLCGAALQLALVGDSYLIGASGCGTALLLAFTTMIPETKLTMIFPLPITLRARTLGRAVIIISAVLSVFSLIGTPQDSMVGLVGRVAHLDHLGGALFGLFFVRRLGYHGGSYTREQMMRERARGERFWERGLRKGKTRKKIVDAKVVEIRPGASREKPIVTPDMDAILDKVGEKGYASLTKEERALLERASEAIRARDEKK